MLFHLCFPEENDTTTPNYTAPGAGGGLALPLPPQQLTHKLRALRGKE